MVRQRVHRFMLSLVLLLVLVGGQTGGATSVRAAPRPEGPETLRSTAPLIVPASSRRSKTTSTIRR